MGLESSNRRRRNDDRERRPHGGSEDRRRIEREYRRSMDEDRSRRDHRSNHQSSKDIKRRNSDIEYRRKKSAPVSDAERRRRAAKKKKMLQEKKQARRKMIRTVVIVLLIAAGIGVVTRGWGSYYNSKGIHAYSDGEYEAANDYFKKAIEHEDKRGLYYMNQGMAQSELKLYDEAAKSFEEALELTKRESKRKEIYRARGISYMYQGKYDAAIEDFERIMDGRESRFSEFEQDVLYYKAETEDKAGKYVEAVMTYTKLVEDTQSAEAYMLRGLEYVKVGDDTSAEADLREAIRKDKKNYEIYLALYKALIGQNKTQEAEQVLNEALLLGGNKGEDLARQGHIYIKLQKYDEAKEKFNEALDKKENLGNLGLAECAIAQNNDEEAIKYFEAYVAEEKHDARAYNEYGNCLMNLGRYAEAEKVFSEGVALNNRLMDRCLSKNRISAAERGGNWSKALEYVDIYLQRYSDDEEAVREKAFIETRIR